MNIDKNRVIGQTLIVLVKRAGGSVTVPCSELDDTGGHVLMMEVDPETKEFTFKLEHKQ